METNRQRLERLGMMDDETIRDVSIENGLCKVCEQAIYYWLDEEAVEED